MPILGQSSFRRLLLTRILLFSIPVLLLGVAVTFHKARSSLLYTAQQNLAQSAARKADAVSSSIQSLQVALAIASQTEVLKYGSATSANRFLNLASRQMPNVRCLQLTELETQRMIASTCGKQPIALEKNHRWERGEDRGIEDFKNQFKLHTLSVNPQRRAPQQNLSSQLDVVLSVPIYDFRGKIGYSLSAQSVLKQRENADPWSFLGYTVIVDNDGKILAHPLRDRVGRNISREPDYLRYEEILRNAQQGKSGTLNLENFDGDNTEWLVGYSPIKVATSASESRIWTVMAVAPTKHALAGLSSITQVLLVLTGGLLVAHLLGMLYMARDLALPIEKLGRYAREIHKRSLQQNAPKNFRVRELNQLAVVLDLMVNRLEERARELEAAWQEAEAANQLKSEFLATTSHELRTPLNAIIGCLRLVQDGYCDSREEELDLLKQADKAAIHLLKIINDLLDIRGIEQGKIRLFMETVNLGQTLREVIELQSVEIQRKHLRLTVPDLSMPMLVRADPARLKQIILNVLSNAVKFTDEGEIAIETRIIEKIGETFSVSPNSRGGASETHDFSTASGKAPWIVITIRDTGIGIDPDQQSKLFRPFVMADGSTTRKFEGTGLGLAISRNLVEQMDGTIQLYSAGLEQGTTVEIAFPLISSPQSLPQAADQSSGTERLTVGSQS